MRFPHNTHPNIFLDPDPGEGGGGGNEEAEKPFSVSAEDWQTAQTELNELRGVKDRYGNLEKEFGSMKERFKPFLESSSEQADKEPDQSDSSRYPRTPEGAKAYLRDYTAYQFKQLNVQQDKVRQASEADQLSAQQETQKINSLVSEHMKRVAEVSKTVPDFDKVTANGLINFNQHAPLAKAILKLKNSAMVEYHLAKNPQEAMQLIRTAAVDLDEAKEVLFTLNHRYTEDAKKSAARRQAERGGFGPTESVEGEMQASGDDASDEEFVRKSLGLKAKK